MTKTYERTRNFLVYSVVFAAALSVSSFLANMLMARSTTQGRTATSPIPFTPVASADIPGSGSDGCDGGGGDGGCDA